MPMQAGQSLLTEARHHKVHHSIMHVPGLAHLVQPAVAGVDLLGWGRGEEVVSFMAMCKVRSRNGPKSNAV